MTVEAFQATEPFQLSLPVFEGDVDDLLRLVSQRKISTSDLHVASVTEQFRSYLASAEQPDLDLTGEFVSASARLLVMKSADLLVIEGDHEEFGSSEHAPRTADEDLKAASLLLRAREGMESFAPDVPPFAPPKAMQPRSPLLLVRAWEGLDRRTRTRIKRVAVPSFVRLEAALSGLIRQLKARNRVSFASLLRGAGRNDAVVNFIAVLELVRRRQATATQEGLLTDIIVEWAEDGAEAAERAG
jgi:segregation and condensation protein A